MVDSVLHLPGKRQVDFEKMVYFDENIGEHLSIRRNLSDPQNRQRPKNSYDKKIENLKLYGRPTLLQFEKSEPGIEWLAQNWRKQRLSYISSSPYLTILSLFAEEHKFFPSVKEIMNGLIQA